MRYIITREEHQNVVTWNFTKKTLFSKKDGYNIVQEFKPELREILDVISGQEFRRVFADSLSAVEYIEEQIESMPENSEIKYSGDERCRTTIVLYCDRIIATFVARRTEFNYTEVYGYIR